MLHRWFRRRAIAIAASSVAGDDADDVVTRPVRARTVPFQMPSLASATRDYAYAITMGTLQRLDERELARLRLAMGPEIWAWNYARRLTGQVPWRAAPTVTERYERVRADRQMTADIAIWERALAELDAETERAQLYGKPRPEPLIVPAAVASIIEARRAAALERAARRRGQSGDERSAPAPAPEGTAGPPSPSL